MDMVGSFYHPLWRLPVEGEAAAAPGGVTVGQNISMVHLWKIPGVGMMGPGQVLSDVTSQEREAANTLNLQTCILTQHYLAKPGPSDLEEFFLPLLLALGLCRAHGDNLDCNRCFLNKVETN